MKKTLAIVLALVMVLAMIPAMSAEVNQQITKNDGQYDLSIWSYNDAAGSNTATAANTVELKYNYKAAEADVVGKWSDKVTVAIVKVDGFTADFGANAVATVDGKALATEEGCEYAGYVGFDYNDDAVYFPVELTKAGYTDTFLVTVTETTAGKTMTENAKVSIKLVNTASYKAAETAVVTNIVSTNAAGFDAASAYIVGDKIYVDFVEDTVDYAQIKLTFAKANGAAFSEISYAKLPEIKTAAGYYTDLHTINANGAEEAKLDKSTMKYNLGDDAANGKTVRFVLESKDTVYATKDYTIKVRYGITEEDPKGIYFAETTKTIAMGEKYSPVVVGVKTGKPVAATLELGNKTDAEVIDLIDNNTTVIGTREGVAYITAKYQTNAAGKTTYTSSSMKIIVTLPGESIPEVEPSAEIYYVTCRNLNVRAGAGTSYKKVDMIHRGDAVKVLEIKNGWAKVADGTYVCAKYIAK